MFGRKSSALLTVDNRRHVESLAGAKEGMVVFNRELNAKMAYRKGKWVTFTDGDKVANNLAGYTFCLTGKMWTTREKVESAIQTASGRVSRSMTQNAILVQGGVSGTGIKSKKQLDAERNGHVVIDHHQLRYVIGGSKSMTEVLGRPKGTPKKKKRIPAEPIDRDKQNRTVKQVFDDIEAIAFGK